MKTEKDKLRAKAWRENNVEHIRRYQKEYRRKNKEKRSAYNKIWRTKNHQTILEEKAKYRETHRVELNNKQKVYNMKHKKEKSNWDYINRRKNLKRYMLYAAKRRAKKNGWDFNLEEADIIIPEYCPVLGLKLNVGEGKREPGSPSLDRIDSSKGYIKGNIMVISWRANDLKRDATLEEMQKLFQFYYGLQSGTL